MEKQHTYLLTVSEFYKPVGKRKGKGDMLTNVRRDFDDPEACFEAFIEKIDELQAQGYKFKDCYNVHYLFTKEGSQNYYVLALMKERIR